MENNLSDMFNVRGKVCVITGGSGVLCGHIAGALAGAGAKVAVLGRRLEKANKVSEEIRESGGEAISVVCDVLDKESVQKAYREVLSKFGDIDVLINGAGGAAPEASTDKEFFEYGDTGSGLKNIFNLDMEAFRRTSDLNFIGSVIPIQIFTLKMIESKKGCIINISSMGADRPLTKSPAYSAGKAAIANFTKWLAVYLAKVNIRVNAIAPGFFLTPRGNKIINSTPQGRFGNPEDLVSTVIWLISEKSSFITGAVISVDGGFSAYGV